MRRFRGIVAALALAACGGGLQAATVCEAGSDCAAGLACLPVESVQYTTLNGADAGCSEHPGDTICTKSCATDADCASLKAPAGIEGTWKCFSGCGAGNSVCGLAG